MKNCAWARLRKLSTPVFALVCALTLTGLLAADETTPVLGIPSFGASEVEVTRKWGLPAFRSASILMYQVSVPAGEASLAADLTFWFQSDRLFYASYSFHIPKDDPESLREAFEVVSVLLAELHGSPASRTHSEGVFTTEVWNLPDSEIEHTVVLDPARADHTVIFTIPPE